MSSKGFQGIKQQAEGAAQDAKSLGKMLLFISWFIFRSILKGGPEAFQSHFAPDANALGQAAQDAVNQATNASQKAMDHICKTAQDGVEKATDQATEAMSAFGKKCSFKK